jgi:hypothetical protein
MYNEDSECADYLLMHKNIAVANITLDRATGAISKIGKVYNPSHLPVGTTRVFIKDINPDMKSLNEWWISRSIPKGRMDMKCIMMGVLHEYTGRSMPHLLLERCYGLSLSDQYWIRPKNSGILWDSVNFFTNGFPMDMGEILFGLKPSSLKTISFMSPDVTTDGWLRKKWVIKDGKRVLMKGGSSLSKQEPYNEAIASAIMRRLGVDHVAYTVTDYKGEP